MGIDASISVGGRPTSKYDFPEKVPKKLSDLENDLFYGDLSPVISLNKDDFSFVGSGEFGKIKYYKGSAKIKWYDSIDDMLIRVKAYNSLTNELTDLVSFGPLDAYNGIFGDDLEYKEISKDSRGVITFSLTLRLSGLFFVSVVSGCNYSDTSISEDKYYVLVHSMFLDKAEKFLVEICRRTIDKKIDPCFISGMSSIYEKIDSLTERISALEEVNSTSTTQETTEETT